MHTKGPWSAGLNVIINAARGIQAHYQGEAWKDRLDEWDNITQANARLIAAAPELLEALEAVAMLIEDANSLAPNYRLKMCIAAETALPYLQEAIRKAKER